MPDMYDPAEIELPPSYSDTLEDKPRLYQRHRRQLWDQLSEDEVRESIAHYYAYCTMEDDLFGEVLDALDATGQADNTVVIFMSDHGDYCGDHGLYLKGVPAFRGAYHVPCIVRWPDGIAEPRPRGRRIRDPGRLRTHLPGTGRGRCAGRPQRSQLRPLPQRRQARRLDRHLLHPVQRRRTLLHAALGR